MFRLFSYLTRCLIPIHLWHMDVHEHTVILIGFELLKALNTIGCEIDPKVTQPQELLCDFLINFVVFN